MELRNIPNDELLKHLIVLVRQEREDTAAVVEHLAEVDRRDLVQKRGYPSLFEYCVKKLGYSEPSAYHRIRAARAIKKKPDLLTLLKAGDLHLEAIVLLHPHLDDARAEELVQRARGKSKREVETFLAPLSPRAEPRDAIRVLAVASEPVDDMPLFETAAPAPALEQPELRSQLSFTAGPVLIELLNGAKGLLWHKFPEGRLEDIFTESLRALMESKHPAQEAASNRRMRSRTRKIPKWIRRQVWKRDQGTCVYQAADGRRCGSRTGLELDHIRPWARGGSSNDPANIRLLCRAHNQLMAQRAGLQRPEKVPIAAPPMIRAPATTDERVSFPSPSAAIKAVENSGVR